MNEEPQLEIAKQLFSEWRATRTNKREPIPKALEIAAARAAKESGSGRTATALGLGGSRLSKTKHLLSNNRRSKPQKKESKLKVTKVIPVSTLQEAAVAVEIVFPMGAKVRIYEKSTALVEALRASICELSAKEKSC